MSAAPAWAHLDLTYPPMRGGNQKVGPCEGVSFQGAPVTTLEPGSEITVSITETIGHPGHYRIMFDPDVTDGEDFPDPTNCDDVGTPDGMYLLADKLLPAQGGTCPDFHTPSERTVASGVAYEFDITLPDVECDNCALQIIQVMTDASKADADGNWRPTGGGGLYFRCANLQLTRGTGTDPTDPGTDPDPDPDPDPGTDPEPTNPPTGELSGGCSTSGGHGSAALLFAAAAFVVLARRRRS